MCTWPPQLFSNDFLDRSYEYQENFDFAAGYEEQSEDYTDEDDLDHVTSHRESHSEDSDCIPEVRYAEKNPIYDGNEPVSALNDNKDGSALEATWEDARVSGHDSAEDEHAPMLGFVRTNIDEWTSSDAARESRVPLDSIQLSPKPPRDLPQLATSFRNMYTCLPNADSVRLLRLHGSASESNPVHCTLLVYGLRDPSRPTFEAFSYTWADSQGNSSLCEAIFMGQQYDVLPVTKNCLAALRSFRTSADRLVWVDAVCINQFDLKERAQQVSLMRDIYMSAARVLTYLGDWNEKLGDVMTLPHYNDWNSDNLYGASSANLSAIFRLPYFSRIWVIQEVLLNRVATLSFGYHTIHWRDFWVLAQHSSSSQGHRPASVLLEPAHVRARYASLLSWLEATKDCRCGDLRDRVYGLMGLISVEDRRNLPVDYSISKQQLYIGLAMYWLTCSDKYGDLLSAVLDLALLPKATSCLPSWAPDWTPQPHPDVDKGRTPLTLRLDPTDIEGSSSELKWSTLSSNIGSHDPSVRWSLDEAFRGRRDYFTEFPPWYKLAMDAGWKPLVSVKPLPLGGTLALEAVHIISLSKGMLQLTDVNGTALHGLLFGDSDSRQQDLPHGDIHLYISLDWQEALVLRKHAESVYSLQNRFQIVCAPPRAPIPSHCGSILDIDTRLEMFEAEIVEHWLMDLFFYGTCAGSAYTDSSRGPSFGRDWSEHFPHASVACQDLNLSFDEPIGKDRLRSIMAVMSKISEEARDSIDETDVPFWIHRNPEPVSPESEEEEKLVRFVNIYVNEAEDDTLTEHIQDAYAYKPRTALSPEGLCTHFRSVTSRYQHSCQNYAPLQSALCDLRRSSHKPLPYSHTETKLWDLLMPTISIVGRKDFVPFWRISLAKHSVIYAAWALLQEIKIDSEFTLEQNFNILWIHVLTMEMVARLRGCLQQRLILKALSDKMRNPQRIYLI